MVIKSGLHRQRITIEGLVQGVGFRPFVYRLATLNHLTGFIFNDSQGVTIEIEGLNSALKNFLKHLQSQKPSLAFYYSVHHYGIPCRHDSSFVIQESHKTIAVIPWVLPDVATCPDCLNEMNNPIDRRFKYPFINCTNCGPRFSIIRAMPYDRPQTTMNEFAMCPDCTAEYQKPTDRRFHAQPIACPSCGPQLRLLDRRGQSISTSDCINKVVEFLNDGSIVALKGLGGYQLLVDATNEKAVEDLRARKSRPEKPFALMFQNSGIVKQYVSAFAAEKLLNSHEAPIIILKRKKHTNLASNVAPDSINIGVLLPYTPLHHLIMDQFNRPIVCTSANLSGEPIIIDDTEAIKKLGPIADYFLIHNRHIQHHIDDSVIRMYRSHPLFIRRARGYVPLPILTKMSLLPILALGGQQKNTIALGKDHQILVSQHISDLDSKASLDRFEAVIQEFESFYHIQPKYIACDAHPDYESTKKASAFGLPVIPVYHHAAHVAACLLDNHYDKEVLGVAWDGTGLGPDGTIWGGEFLLTSSTNSEHIASIKPFYLIGGEQAIKEPKRVALSLLYETYGEACFELPWSNTHFSYQELSLFRSMLKSKNNLQITTSMGRLFDGVAALLNLKDVVSYEGQAAMMLEDLAVSCPSSYPFSIKSHSQWSIDWTQMIESIQNDLTHSINSGLIAGKFHRTLGEMTLAIAEKSKVKTIALSGGCFQNKVLLKLTVSALRTNGFKVLTHHQLPPNDGGLSAGQIMVAERIICA